jgi:hypothetical protein
MIDVHGEPVRENYRRQGEARERERIIALIERRICFDALADHATLPSIVREAHPEVVGRCSHHGGKCTDLLLLIHELKIGKK